MPGLGGFGAHRAVGSSGPPRSIASWPRAALCCADMGIEEVFGLAGKTVFVLGASSGLGAECARALASAGANVAIGARRLERLEVLAQELRAMGVQALPVAVDARDDGDLARAVDEIESRFGPIWALVNAAGISRLSRAIKHSRDKWDDVIALNLTAAFVSSQLVAAKMVDRGPMGVPID